MSSLFKMFTEENDPIMPMWQKYVDHKISSSPKGEIRVRCFKSITFWHEQMPFYSFIYRRGIYQTVSFATRLWKCGMP